MESREKEKAVFRGEIREYSLLKCFRPQTYLWAGLAGSALGVEVPATLSNSASEIIWQFPLKVEPSSTERRLI